MSRFFKSAAFPILIVVVLAFFAQRLISPSGEAKKPEFKQFLAQVDGGQIKSADLKTKDNTLEATTTSGRKYEVGYPDSYAKDIINRLGKAPNGPRFDVEGKKTNGWLSLLTYVLPFLIFIGFWIFLMNQVQGGGSKVMSFGKSRAKRMSVDSPKITFRDVAGVAGVPFFSISGSDFVEMFVGVGASRVRDLFEQAKQNSPCIIFMDEIDAVGRQRGAGLGGGHDEREQTLNQLLVEMDGFDAKGGIIMIAATNRPDILDPALLRPGRFDRQIVVDRPDLPGREKILRVHSRGKPLGNDVNIEALARSTPGFTGADLANLVNEAALLAARHDKEQIDQTEMEEAIDRVIAGPERKTRLISDKEKEITAYHEAGHAIVGALLPEADPVHKITIIPRGQALGVTMSLPTEDRFMMSRGQLMAQLAMMLGGRAAERVVFDEITTGASNDLERVTQTARQMVTRFGMSEKLGPMALGQQQGQVFMGRDFHAQPDYSDEIAFQIDKEIRRIADESYDTAEDVLVRNRVLLEKLAKELIENETVDAQHLVRLIEEYAVDKVGVEKLLHGHSRNGHPDGRRE